MCSLLLYLQDPETENSLLVCQWMDGQRKCDTFTQRDITQLFKNMKFSGKSIEVEKNHLDRGNPDPERQLWYVFTYVWMLVIKSLVSRWFGIEKGTGGEDLL